MNFSEDFLYFIWQFRLFNKTTLCCASGETLRILSPGIRNKDAGPDFSYAKIRIGDTLWVGNIELHIRSSDWQLHKHQHNKSFDSIILHVVCQNDEPVYRNNGSSIPVLVLEGLFHENLFSRYQNLMNSTSNFPCQPQIKEIDQVVITSFLSRQLVERFEQKSEAVLEKLEQLTGNWNETFYHFIARSFGFKVNAVPFELLAASLPHQLFAKHKDNKMQIEALVYGQAGFLENDDFADNYPRALKAEYAFLQKKYQLNPIDVSLWKFLRMRPQSFPTIRLAQFAALLAKTNHLFSRILEIEDLKTMFLLFQHLPVNDYWLRHYHFNKETKHVNLQIGLQSVQNIIINTVCLFLFSYGKYTDQQHYIDRAFDFLDQLPAENNAIVNQFISSGLKTDSAATSQALLQLNKCYCSQKKCLNCGIGIKILNR